MSGVEFIGGMRPMKSRFLVMPPSKPNRARGFVLMKAGAVDLMQKPFSDETNLAVIHSALLGRDQEVARPSMMFGYLNAL